MKRDLTLFLSDVLEAINKIDSFSEGLSKEDFIKDELRQSAIIRKLEIIGEAIKNIPENFRKKYASIEWKELAELRDVLIHAYFGTDLERVWNVLKLDLPKLKIEINKILEKLRK